MWYEKIVVASLLKAQIFGRPLPRIMLPNGTKFHINETLYSRKSTNNLLSFKDIHKNGYHFETMNEGNTNCLYITSIVSGKKVVVEKLLVISFGLYHTSIKSIDTYVVMN